MIDFTFCKNFAHAETKSVEWDDFAATMSRSKAYGSKEESIKRSAFIGGVRDDEERGRADNVRTRTVVTLDYDELELPLDEIEFMLDLALGDVAFIAWSTFRHTPEHPRVRVCVPLSRQVSADEHSAIVAALVDRVAIGQPDDCSYTINQIMFLPSHQQGVEPWAFRGMSDEFLDVEALLSEVGFEAGFISSGTSRDDVDDLSLALASQPLDISEDEMRVILEAYPAEGKDYDEWLRVGMAIWHQTEGAGYETWRAWSAKSGKHDERHMRTKWRSFGGSATPVTMASIIALTGGRRGGVAVVEPDGEVALSLEQEAEQVADRASYSAFKRRVQSLNEVQLPPDIRSLLASVVHEVYAKGAGMGLREVKAAMKPLKASRASLGEDGEEECPEWLVGWCYHTTDNLFVNVENPALAINDRGFSAKFAHKSEVIASEMRASDYAINHVHIPTVDRLFFMPDTSETFCERNGFQTLNTYRRRGVSPCESLDEDGQAVVDFFLKHIAWTFPNSRDREIVLDWMAHVYQNPGQRVNWALLIWGVQGSGKTLLFNILQRVIGIENTKDVSPSSLKTDYNDWAVGGIVGCVEEIRVSGQNKWAVMDIMKPAITNDYLAINPKGKTSYSGAPNYCSYMMLTNHQDAIPVNDSDRRFCVLFSAHNDTEAMEADHGGAEGLAEYFRVLFDGCVHRRPDAMARFLADYHISPRFDHKGRAPRTEAFSEMLDANTSDERALVNEMIEDHGSDVLCHEMICVTELRAQVVLNADGDLPYGRSLGQLLREMGYKPVGPKCYRVMGTKHYVWIKPARISEDQAKDRVRSFYDHTTDFSDVPF